MGHKPTADLLQEFFRGLSRNRAGLRFEEPGVLEAYRQARKLRALREEIRTPGVAWKAEAEGEKIRLRLIRPTLGIKREVLLSLEHWNLVRGDDDG